MAGTTCCIHLPDRNWHVLNIELTEEQELRDLEDLMRELSIPPIGKYMVLLWSKTD